MDCVAGGNTANCAPSVGFWCATGVPFSNIPRPLGARQQGKTMAGIVVVDRDGVEHEVEAKEGVSLMETLRDLDYGSPAICGGMCSCATCHVFVDEAWVDRLPKQMSDERDMVKDLSCYNPRTSRLACQIPLTAALEGIKVTIAPEE